MFSRAKEVFDSHVVPVTKWEDVVPTLDDKNIIVIPWCEAETCEDDIKDRSGRSCVGVFFTLTYHHDIDIHM